MSDLPAPDVRYAGDTMGQRLKTYEALSDPRLPVGSFYAIRLDGKGFSKYTKKIKAQKPFDLDLMGIMDGVCRDLLLEFHFATVYTQSDEITCIPYFFGDNREAAFSGRLQKLSSVLASYAAASFARHLNAAIGRRPSFATNAYATFDCRVFAVPTKEELLNVLIWRQRDCEKNAKNGFAQSYFSHKALLKKNSDEQVRMVEEMHEPVVSHG
jgi:tRNA(His) guanylyltransferase